MGRPKKHLTHLPSYVYRRSNGFYYEKVKPAVFLGVTEEEALAKYEQRFGRAVGSGALNAMLDEAFEKAVRTRRHRRTGKPLAPRTIELYEIALNGTTGLKHLLRHARSPSDIKQRDVRELRRLFAGHPGAANIRMIVLTLICEYWAEQGIIDANPCVGIKYLPGGKRDVTVSPDEFKAMHEHAPPRLQIMLALWRLTGQRVMDVVNIKREDLREDGIYFRQDKGDDQLIVGWSPALREAVEQAKRLNGNVTTAYLFQSRNAKRRNMPPKYRTIATQWGRMLKKAGIINRQIRDLRATAITAASLQGLNATALAGHRSPKTTQIYIRDRIVPIVQAPIFESAGSFGRVLDFGKTRVKKQVLNS